MTANAGRSHDDVVEESLKADTELADAYLAAALEEIEQPGGHQAMMTALRHVAESQGMANVAKKQACPESRCTVRLAQVAIPLSKPY